LDECRALHGCATGQAKITRGYSLPARWVIHTVGPVWRGGGAQEDEMLAACYRNSLLLAVVQGCRTVAFPAISTGVYGFPPERAAPIAVREVRLFLAGDLSLEQVLLVCFGQTAYELMLRALAE
jgi:O-acetyl-ADP-ribose deacetylase